MRRAIRTGLIVFASIASLASAGVVKNHGALQVKGNRIVDASGTPLQVAGMSLFWSGWMGKYWNSGVVNTLVNDWNSSLVRAAMGIEGGGNYLGPKDATDKRTDEQIKQANKDMVIAVVDAAIANDIYVIIDWHDHNATQHTAQAVAFFGEMSAKYKNDPHVIYELFNEPLQIPWSDIKSYAQTVTTEIRKNSNNLIVVGTPSWSQNVDEAAASPLSDANTAYTLHFYAGTHVLAPNTDPKKGPSLGDKARTALSKGVALFITEWGTSVSNGGTTGTPPVSDNKVWTAESDAWLAFAKENGLSWANWSLADKAESSAALKPNAPSNGGWNDGNLSPAGLYVRGKIREVTNAINTAISVRPASFGTTSSFAARIGARGLDLTLPEVSSEVVISDLQGKIRHRQILTGQREIHLPVASSGLLLVQVATPTGLRSVTVAPVR